MKNNLSDSIISAATYVGNRLASSLDLIGPDKKTLREKYLVGEPQDCAAGKACDMKKRGFVGIYLKNPATMFRLPHTGQLIQKCW